MQNRNKIGIPVTHTNNGCNHYWIYTGKSTHYIACPKCLCKFSLTKAIREGNASTEKILIPFTELNKKTKITVISPKKLTGDIIEDLGLHFD